jgi:hypothetical protein
LALTRLREHSFTAIIEWDKLQEDFDNRTPKCAGWERTSDDKLTFRSVNLRFMFDPIKYVFIFFFYQFLIIIIFSELWSKPWI